MKKQFPITFRFNSHLVVVSQPVPGHYHFYYFHPYRHEMFEMANDVNVDPMLESAYTASYEALTSSQQEIVNYFFDCFD